MPAATQEGLLNALNALREDGRDELTLLVLGKGGVGKSRCALQCCLACHRQPVQPCAWASRR